MLFIASMLAATIEIPRSLRNGVFNLDTRAWKKILKRDLDDFNKNPSSAGFANLAEQLLAFEDKLLDFTFLDGAKARYHNLGKNWEEWSKYSEEFHVYLTELLNNVSMSSKTQLSPAQFEALLHKVTTGPIRLTAEATEEIRILMKSSPEDINKFAAIKSKFILEWDSFVHMDRYSEDIAKILAFKIHILDLFDHKINAALVKLELPFHPEWIAKITSKAAFLGRAFDVVSRSKVKKDIAVAAIFGVGGALYVASQNGLLQGHLKNSSQLQDINDSPKNNAGNVVGPLVQVFVEDLAKLETKSITPSPDLNIESVENPNRSQLEPLRADEAVSAKI